MYLIHSVWGWCVKTGIPFFLWPCQFHSAERASGLPDHVLWICMLREVVVIVSQFNSPEATSFLLKLEEQLASGGITHRMFVRPDVLVFIVYPWGNVSGHWVTREGWKTSNYKPADINKEGFLHSFSLFSFYYFFLLCDFFFFFWTNFLWFLNQISRLQLESFHIFRIIIERFVMRLNTSKDKGMGESWVV